MARQGHHRGRSESVGLAASLGDLAKSVNAIDGWVSKGLSKLILQNDEVALSQLASKIKVYNSNTNIVNHWDNHLPDVKIYHVVGAKGHELSKMKAALEEYGTIAEVSPKLYGFVAGSFDTQGNYILTRDEITSNIKNVAQQLNLPEEQISLKWESGIGNVPGRNVFTVKPINLHKEKQS
jgi:hypothetical protein